MQENFDLFDVGKIDEEIKDFDNTPSKYELQKKIQELEEELKSANKKIEQLKSEQRKRKRQTEKARKRRSEKSTEVYGYIQNLIKNGHTRKEILKETYRRRDGTEIKISEKMYRNAKSQLI